MRNRSAAFFMAMLLWLPHASQAHSVALSFDDGLDPREQTQAASWSASILEALSKANIKSILYAAGKRVDGTVGLMLVRD